MNAAGFFFRTILLGLFTLSLLAGAIVTDYYLRHEITRKAKRFLEANGVALTPGSAIDAAHKGELVLLQKLENAGISLGTSDENGRTPLLAAVESRNLQVIDFLMERDPVIESINHLTSTERDSPLAAALRAEDFELAEDLIEKGAHLEIDLETGVPALVVAIQTENEALFDFLLKHEVDVNYHSAQVFGPLSIAAEEEGTQWMARLLRAGADPNARGVSGKPLLIEAARVGNGERVKLLLRHEATVSATTVLPNGATVSALSYAVDSDDANLRRILLEAKANPDVDCLTGDPLILDVF
ncbi:MAG: ankyrin repeat domain-containing protein, partial [Verrucomicrobiota bacterium]